MSCLVIRLICAFDMYLPGMSISFLQAGFVRADWYLGIIVSAMIAALANFSLQQILMICDVH